MMNFIINTIRSFYCQSISDLLIMSIRQNINVHVSQLLMDINWTHEVLYINHFNIEFFSNHFRILFVKFYELLSHFFSNQFKLFFIYLMNSAKLRKLT